MPSFKDSAPFISILIALISMVAVFYKDFIQGSNLETVLTTLVIVRVPENNKSAILEQVILDDLLSGRPSDQAQNYILSNKDIAEGVRTRNREMTRNSLINYSIQLSKEGKKLIYDATAENLSKYFGDKNFTIGFYTPLNIVNTGRKTGDITTLILQITSISDPKNKWVYSCFTEIRAEEFTKFTPNQPYGTIVGKLFPGISIGATSNYRLDAFLIPIDAVNNKIISKTTLTPGKYNVQIIGFGSNNKKCLESNVGTFNVDNKTLVDCFNGSNIAINLTMDNNIEKIL